MEQLIPPDAEKRSSDVLTGDGTAAASPPPDVQDPDAPVLAELERQQNQRPGWGQAIVILIVSVAMFLGIGMFRNTWEVLLYLIPILFVHELGHFIAMRTFGYRNLRMFFIPLFGAAVSGRHYNVAGWKKAIVSLAGPVPSIALGVGLGIVGLFVGQRWLVQAASLMLIVNGFQLVPMLPFDGGHVLHATLFCRHPVLDVAFRIAAIAGMLGLAWLTGDRVLLFIAIAMAVFLPAVWGMSRTAARLQAAGVGQSVVESSLDEPVPQPQAPSESVEIGETGRREAPQDDQAIPEHTAREIIAEVRRSYTAKLNPRTIAGLTLQIYETLNAHPPDWLVTLLILFVHAGSFVLSVAAALVFLLASRPAL